MRYFSKIFWVSLLLFVINQLLERAGIFIPFIHSYLDDFLCPSIVLGFTLSFQQQLTYRAAQYRFAPAHVVAFVLWYFVLFEWVFPSYDDRHFSDPMDLLAYTAGGLLFYFLGNKPAPGLVSMKLGKSGA